MSASDNAVVVGMGNQPTTTTVELPRVTDVPVDEEEDRSKKMSRPSRNKMRTDHADKEK